MSENNLGFNTTCVHTGEVPDEQFKGAVSPLYMATSYKSNEEIKRYPRAFNTPNQEHLAKKIAALEFAESGLIFGSGMAAISAVFLTFLKSGDHLVVQNTLYGGTANFIKNDLSRYGVEFTFTDGYQVEDFEKAIRPNTKLIHIETPSNPLLTITDVRGIGELGKKKGILTSIDNTFASPVLQNPIKLGIDIVIHSATKYLGGHSDIMAGAVVSTETIMKDIHRVAMNFGGCLSDFTVWMLERSMKTLGLRVKAQTRNAKKLAKYLYTHENIEKVYYPGLKSHPEHELAKSQMKGYGAMISFELKDSLDVARFFDALKIIKPSLSLAGVESTMLLPAETSHSFISQKERDAIGITDRLIRFSVGIESKTDLINDIEQAIEASK